MSTPDKASVAPVTKQDEARESRTRITRVAAVEIIANGVEIPQTLPSQGPWQQDGKLRLMFIGRLHQKKGIENLLQAMKRLDPDDTLVICGTGDSEYTASLKQMTHALELEGRVQFRGQVDGPARLQAFSEADVCIVPSFTENFAMVNAEALAHGVPVIASRGTP